MTMKRTDRVRWGELKVGLLVTFGLGFLLWASFTGGGTSLFYKKLELNTLLNSANGLNAGGPVRLSGVEVGKVTELKLIGRSPDEQVYVKMSIEERAWSIIKSDSRATLGTIGMLGDKYIEITPGSLDLPDLEPGAYIEGRVAGDLLGLIDRAPEMVGNLEDLARALGKLARHLEGTEGTLGQLLYSDSLYYSVLATTEKARGMMADLDQRVAPVLSQSQETLESVGRAADRLSDTSGTVGRLLASGTLYDRLDGIAARLDTLTRGLVAGDGTAGALLREDQIYEDLHKTILDLQFLLKDVRENPKRYVTFKVF